MITFPHIGPVYLTAALMLKELGIPAAVPPANTSETLERGKSVSPEEMCLPFKFMAGNLIQAYEQGARSVIMPATVGPCRLGEYGELLKRLLDEAGYEMEWHLLDSPGTIGIRQWFARLKQAGRNRTVKGPRVLFICIRAVRLMQQIDNLEAEIKRRSAYMKEPGSCVGLLRGFRKALSEQERMAGAFAAVRDCKRALRKLPLESGRRPVKILVTGEIYTSIETAANQGLEERLMLMGCEVRRPVTISWWIRHTIRAGLGVGRKAGSNYLPYSIGGYARETVQDMEQSGEDGIIKIMPSGCMPEIVAKAASSVMEEEHGIKVLHLIFDEMRGAAGYETRIEAFVDMLERRKCVLSGN
ncbi:MAG: hypothetical protein HFE76_04070 [Firmicutes bacterium]|nr:hypothetical protein [Bacillota bacterium]